MAMSPSSGHHRGKSIGDPILRKKASAEPPLLLQLLPKVTLQLASSLSNDDKEVLAYLVLYGRHVLLATGTLSSACRSPWKPWKYSSSNASKRQQVFPSYPNSDSCTQSFVSIGEAEEFSSKRSPLLHTKHKASFSCECFSCYSCFWSRWNASPNRDLINDILDEIEKCPQNSKSKKKKKADKKRVVLENEACSEQNMGRDENEWVHMSGASGVNDEWPMPSKTSNDGFTVTDLNGKDIMGFTCVLDDASPASIVGDEALTIVTRSVITGRKKSLFRVMKQKEVTRSPDLRCKVSGAEGVENKALSGFGVSGERAVTSIEAAVPIALPTSRTIDLEESMDVGLSLAFSQGKNASHRHRIVKRRSNQVTPLDCEGVSAMEEKQESTIAMENAQPPVSPRAADIGLAGRGLLARVFPDALGRVASRLWDLVSARLWSRTVEYH